MCTVDSTNSCLHPEQTCHTNCLVCILFENPGICDDYSFPIRVITSQPGIRVYYYHAFGVFAPYLGTSEDDYYCSGWLHQTRPGKLHLNCTSVCMIYHASVVICTICIRDEPQCVCPTLLWPNCALSGFFISSFGINVIYLYELQCVCPTVLWPNCTLSGFIDGGTESLLRPYQFKNGSSLVVHT